ncbi:MAG: damage-inducible protein, partial [Chloroflexi bacterium]|nr:damage-inducible protein [Chloroflexota bacterium]
MRDAGSEADYEPFDGIVLTDTFQSSEPHDRQDTSMFPRNNERIERQLALDIRVILGNPPWSVGQGRYDDQNVNQPYPALDAMLSASYAANSIATSKKQLHDSYVRAIRWASNRVTQSSSGGIVGFVTNSGFVDTKAFDGFRKAVASEFHAIHVYNLRGNQRTSGEQSRSEGGKVFGSGSRAGVAILLLVKRPESVPE